MNRSDVFIFLAVHEVYDGVASPRGRDWTTAAGKRELARLILSVVELDDVLMDRIFACFDNYGKSRDLHRTLLEIIKRDGSRCFWQRFRPDIKCSDDLTVEHLIPQSRQGDRMWGDDPRNLVASCRSHNSARGDKPLEDFICTCW